MIKGLISSLVCSRHGNLIDHVKNTDVGTDVVVFFMFLCSCCDTCSMFLYLSLYNRCVKLSCGRLIIVKMGLKNSPSPFRRIVYFSQSNQGCFTNNTICYCVAPGCQMVLGKDNTKSLIRSAKWILYFSQ